MPYVLGASSPSDKFTAPIVIRDTKNVIEGVSAWARDEKTGRYVRVFDFALTQYVDGVAQASEEGNFETKEAARAAASSAYRYINKK